MSEATVRTRRWSRREYARLIDYRAVTTVPADERVVPLAAPFSSLLVANLLP